MNQDKARRLSPRVTWVYALFLSVIAAAVFLRPLSALFMLIAIALAFLGRPLASPAEASHYLFQIRTFWIWLVGIFVGIALRPVGIGWLIIAGVGFWLLVRAVQGLRLARAQRPHPRPLVWFWL